MSRSSKQLLLVFSLSVVSSQLNLSELYSWSCKPILSEVGFLPNRHFPAPLLLWLYLAAQTVWGWWGGGHTCHSRQRIQGFCLTGPGHNRPLCCCCRRTEDPVSHRHRYHRGQQVTDQQTEPLADCESNIPKKKLQKAKVHLIVLNFVQDHWLKVTVI